MKPCDVRWLVSFSASCIHAADALASGENLLDQQLADVLGPPALALRDELRDAGLPEERCWRFLNALAYQIENNRELAAATLRKTIGKQHEPLVIQLAGRIAALESAMRQALPQLVDDLTLRARPLRELWEACGPGLLNSVARLTDERLIVDNADVVCVHPVLGGHGAAHLTNNSVRIEAVLTNNVPQLPETVRLTWLLAQLNLDVPMFSERIHADRLPRVASLAMLPPVLQAASELELCAYDRPNLTRAISAWRVGSAPDSTAEIVSLWWDTYLAAPTSWATALTAIDQMLGSGE